MQRKLEKEFNKKRCKKLRSLGVQKEIIRRL